MKPQDLKIPFSFEERKVQEQDGLLFLPDCLERYPPIFFHHQGQPFIVELCSGNGHWICNKAKNEPEKRFVAVEKRFDRIQKIWSKKQNEGLDNLYIVWGKAETWMKYFCEAKSIDELYIHFPDPWPKNRHRKHRLFQTLFLQDVRLAMKPKGGLFLVTDHLQYGKQALQCLQKTNFSLRLDKPGYKVLSSYGNSTFEALWKSLGEKIYYFEFEVSDEPL